MRIAGIARMQTRTVSSRSQFWQALGRTRLTHGRSRAAENNPANDYPDEELSWDDEEDDPTAVYNKYRTQARSDDEEFDFDDSASEGRQRGGFGFRSHVESDEESW